MPDQTPSRCSSGSPVQFRWYGFPSSPIGSDIEVATNVFSEALKAPGRLWNPYNLATTKAEFKKVIVRGTKGDLVPIDEVLVVDEEHPPLMFELRWQDITVTVQGIDGAPNGFETIIVRMYHTEPEDAPGYFIGHHIHEKIIDEPNTWALQNVEIAVAVRFHQSGERDTWGIPITSP